MSSRLPTRAVQPVGRLLDRGQQVPLVLGRPHDGGVPQAGDRGLDRGQRAAQVVGDRGQQSGLGPVALGQLRRALRLLGRPAAFPQHRRSAPRTRSAGSGRPPPAGDRGAPGVTSGSRVDLDVGLVVGLRCEPAAGLDLDGAVRTAAGPGRRRSSRAPRRPGAAARSGRRRSAADCGPARPGRWPRPGPGRPRRSGGRTGRPPWPPRPRRPRRRTMANAFSGSAMVRVPVGGTNRKFSARLLSTRGQHRRPQSADQGGGHHEGQHQHRLGRQPVQVRGQQSSPSQHGGAEHGQRR